MLESFLHHVWKYRLFNEQNLTLTTGESVEIIQPGTHNTDAGPDFFDARIKIGNTLWAGNVELHEKTSQWFSHKHDANPLYQNIILHVVAHNDLAHDAPKNPNIPVLVITWPEHIYQQYLYLMQSTGWIPCESFIGKVDEFTILQWKEALLVERLAQKSQIISERFEQSNKNWEETLYQTMANNFGFKVNSVPFELLAKGLPLAIIGKHKDNIQLVEAMLFGQAGLLPQTASDEYQKQLETDYAHLRAKFSLTPMSGHLWKFMRMRPLNFPTIRIAQFAMLIHQSHGLLSKILELEKASEALTFFDLNTSTYWNTHYTFTHESPKINKHFGTEAFHNVVINTLAPFLFFYGNYRGQPEFSQRALDWLTQIPAEKNSIITAWGHFGLTAQSAFDSQALIQLKNSYCNHRKCLNCRIGNQVIRATI